MMFLRRALPIFTLALLSTFATSQQAAKQSAAPTAEGPHPALAASYGKLPLGFEANAGQSDRAAKFLARGNGYAVFLTDKEAVLALSKVNKGAARRDAVLGKHPAQTAANTDVVRLQLSGAAPGLKVSGEDRLPGTANYFIGNDPAKWHSNVPTYAKVRYAAVYPGVDLVYYGSQRQLEYDFVVVPGADAGQVKLRFAGAEKLTLNSDGDLTVAAKHGEINFHKPVVYQVSDGKRLEVEGRFELLAGNKVGFSLGSYDKGRELVIDPVLEYSTYLGGAGSDYAAGIAVDSSGNAYVTGYTYSTKFPVTTGAYQTTNAYTTNTSQSAVFVSKLNASGTGLVYSTYLGGTAFHCTAGPNPNALVLTGDFGSAIAVDSSGDAFIAGGTCANDFPTTTGAFLTTDVGAYHHATNAFMTKLNSSGSNLVYSTYLGGRGSSYSGDWANGIAVDSAGNAFVTGQSSSPNFPTTTGAFQTTNKSASGRNNAFITKINPTGTALIYSTYLGGSGNTAGGTSPSGDSGSAIAINSFGNAYITGYTYSNNFPLTASTAYQTTNKAYAIGGSSPFVTEMSADGKSLVYSTYFGGSTKSGNINDYGSGIAVDAAGNIYVAGGTASTDFPITNGAFQTAKNASSGNLANGFISKFNSTGSSLLYSTYLGGSGGSGSTAYGDRIEALAIDGSGDVFVAGYSGSSNFPLAGTPYQSTNKAFANNSKNSFLAELNAAGSALTYSTYFGGSGSTANTFGDYGDAIAYSAGGVYLAGATLSKDFPTTSGAFQKTIAATGTNTNAYIAKFEFATASKTSLVSDGNPEPVGAKVTFTANVVSTGGGVTPTGKVSFAIDKATPVTVALDDTGHAAYSTTALAAGAHNVVATYSGDALNLASTSNTLSETIYGSAATIAVVSGTPQSGVYGAAFGAPLVVVVKDSAGDVVPGATVTFSGAGLKFSSTAVTTGANGQASVTATPVTVGNLTATAAASGVTKTVTFTFNNVAQAVLKVTATNVSVKYGAAIPALTYTVTGYVNGDTSSVVTGAPTETTTAKQGSAVGTYPITLGAGTLAAANYSFTLVNGTVSISSLGVTAEPGATQVITIADATNGAKVYYTTDGSTPTTSSTVYTGPITVTATQTLKFIAVAPGYLASPVRTITDTVK